LAIEKFYFDSCSKVAISIMFPVSLVLNHYWEILLVIKADV